GQDSTVYSGPPNPPGCPASTPQKGDACTLPRATECHYSTPCVMGCTASCDGSHWAVQCQSIACAPVDSGAESSTPPSDAGAPLPCAQGDACGGGLQCLCCGGAGPRAICVCTTACTTSGQCADPARPTCNAPSPGADGICTSTGFNCC